MVVVSAWPQCYNLTMSSEPLSVIAGSPDRPLAINGLEIPCYVLEDETRVLSQGGFLGAIGRSRTPKARKSDVDELPDFLRSKNLASFVSSDFLMSTNPIPFKAPSAGAVALGYDAKLLPMVCDVFLKAREAGVLYKSQRHIAERAEVIVRGLATVGIIALVDEATGYQEVREKNALATILEQFIAKELRPWVKTFPDSFYKEMFRLHGWSGRQGMKCPSVVGYYTNDVVYERLAPGVLSDLQRINPTLSQGRRKDRHHQWLTQTPGHEKLQQHLAGVIALMRAAVDWDSFLRSLQLAFPKDNSQLRFPE